MRTTRREFGAQLGGVAAGIVVSETANPRRAAAGAVSSDLSIDITGLCGLVHDRARARTEVIFVDTTAFGAHVPRHTPVLVANLRDVMNPPEDSKPTTVVAVPSASGSGVEQLGLWDLTDQQLSIRRPGGAEAAAGLRLSKADDTDAVPANLPRNVNDPQQWRDLRYVVDMQRICGDGRVAPALLTQDGSSGSVRQAEVSKIVGARLRLSEGLLEAAIPSQHAFRGVMYEFPRTEGRPAFRQPLTDTVCWRLLDSAATGNYVTIDVRPLRGNPDREPRTLLIAQRGRPTRLSISNLPAENPSHTTAHHTMNDEDMGVFHVGAYYELLLTEPAERSMPKLWRPLRDRKAAGLRPVFCPPAVFSRQ